MTESPETPSPSTQASNGDILGLRLERLDALRSAWGVLAPSALGEQGEQIAESGRALTDHLSKLSGSHSDLSASGLDGIDRLLDEFESSIRLVALSIPISELRSTLPNYRDHGRRNLLDLLDVVLGTGLESAAPVVDRLALIDYLITLLSARTGGSLGDIGFDPVTLTPRLQALCQAADEPDSPLVAEVEAEFFAAASLQGEDLREELEHRTLRARKAALGQAFFAPRVLRAIVTYNAALVARVNDEILESADWGVVEQEGPAESPNADGSVFDSTALRSLASALQRRIAGEPPSPTPIDRIAWALDLNYLEPAEQKSLTNEAITTDADPLGTAILVGLIGRSLAVLSVELQDAGISPDTISDVWIPELQNAFQREINTHLSEDAYKIACALSELKNKFLLAPLADQYRERKAQTRPVAARPAVEAPREGDADAPGTGPEAPEPKPASARDLVRDALEQDRQARAQRRQRLTVSQVPWARLAGIAAAAGLLLAVGLGWLASRNPDLDRMSSEQLASVSPYLEQGLRDGQGTGRSFVGRLDDAWLALPSKERTARARELVTRLRSQGMSQIIIRDGDDRVRIQALGSQPIRTL